MRINKSKRYSIVGYTFLTDGDVSRSDYGEYDGADVRSIIGKAKWDEDFEMFFTENGSKGFEVNEI